MATTTTTPRLDMEASLRPTTTKLCVWRGPGVRFAYLGLGYDGLFVMDENEDYSVRRCPQGLVNCLKGSLALGFDTLRVNAG